ncbi:MAG: family 43 glycosylhydrolase [Bacteroidales bacterium]|nr:family 43 glycosylhydrolase [Bacteroidales bacterium]
MFASDPTACDYAPAGEYIKDHSIIYHDGWYHLFSISGTAGYYHGNNGNEETVSWSISKDLVNWEMRGHVMHASLRKGAFDQHEVWAPFAMKADGKFYMFYTGIIHPFRPLTYGKPGDDHKWIYEGHKETIGLAVSDDLTNWEKISDIVLGLRIPGRDAHVVWDDEGQEWLLYSTGPGNTDGLGQLFVSRSKDLVNWNFWGTCALFPVHAESSTVMRHPLTGKWVVLTNEHYAISDSPLTFLKSEVKKYDRTYKGKDVDWGFAGEMIYYNGKWYRSGVLGEKNNWRLGFTEVEWVEDGCFRIVKPSVIRSVEKP